MISCRLIYKLQNSLTWYKMAIEEQIKKLTKNNQIQTIQFKNQVYKTHQILKSKTFSMSKTLSISIDTLNTLYCKFLNQFVVQYLPKNVYNDVHTLLGMKSAIQVYRYLQKIVNQSSFEDHKSSEGTTGQKSNTSNQGSNTYIQKDDFSFMYLKQDNNDIVTANTTKRPPCQVKRTNTSLEQKSVTQRERQLDANNLQSNQRKQAQPITSTQIISPRQVYPLGPTQAVSTNLITVQRQEFETSSEKHLSSVVSNNLNIKKENNLEHNQNLKEENVTVGGYTFKIRKQPEGQNNNVGNQSNRYVQVASKQNKRQVDKKSDEAGSGGFKKIQFAKTYQTRQVDNNVKSATPHAQPTTSNRFKLQSLIKQTKQIFMQNGKKIQRYEKISAEIMASSKEKGDYVNYHAENSTTVNNYAYVYAKKY